MGNSDGDNDSERPMLSEPLPFSIDCELGHHMDCSCQTCLCGCHLDFGWWKNQDD